MMSRLNDCLRSCRGIMRSILPWEEVGESAAGQAVSARFAVFPGSRRSPWTDYWTVPNLRHQDSAFPRGEPRWMTTLSFCSPAVMSYEKTFQRRSWRTLKLTCTFHSPNFVPLQSLCWDGDFFPQESLDGASLLKLFGRPSQQHETKIA
jgi:hypothetical protein